jgi:hypothetical protein
MEEEGIPTIYLGSCRDMMARVKAPRNAFIDFPLGHQCGKPNDVDLQSRILKDALHVLETAREQGTLVDLDYQWDRPFNWESHQSDLKTMQEEENIQPQSWKPKT